jgi:hypothetical protein
LQQALTNARAGYIIPTSQHTEESKMTHQVFGALSNTLMGLAVVPDTAIPGVTYTMGKTLYREVDDGTDSPEPAEARAARVAAPRAVRVLGAPSKADRVREMIVEAKAVGTRPEVVVVAVVAELGMARGLAAKYVKENWSRV